MTLQSNEEGDKPKQRVPKTLIFFSTKKKLTVTQLQKDFRIKKGKLFKQSMVGPQTILQVEKLYAILSARLEVKNRFYDFSNQKDLTHIFATPFQTCTKSFGWLKYPNDLIGGIDVSPTDWENLEVMLGNYASCVNAVVAKTNLTSGLMQKTLDLVKQGIANEPFPTEVSDQFFTSLNNYLDPLLANAHKAIVDWHEVHRWRDVSEINQQAATLEIPENEARALLAA